MNGYRAMSLSASQTKGGGGSGSGAVVAPSVQTLWGSSISWCQLTKKCTFSLILYLLP